MVSPEHIQRYNLKYRQKLQHRRAISKSFDLHFKAKQNARQRKCRQQKKETQKKVATASASPSNKITSRKTEGAKRRRVNARKSKNQTKKLLKKVQQLQKENLVTKRLLSKQHSAKMKSVNTTPATSPTRLFINNISPSAKTRATKRLLSEKENLSRGSVSKLRKIGVNLSNNYNPPSNTPSALQKDIEDFLCQDDISKQEPDKKKQLHGKQIRYLLNHLSTIHQRFVTETGNNCHYSTFTRYIPDFVVKPNANDWGTCLCVTCLNPQMKFEKLQNLKSRYSIVKSVLIDGLTDITELVTDEIKTKDFKSNLAILKDERFTITYSEWIKKKNDESNILISTKTTVTSSIADFVDKFTNEIENLTHHVDRMRQQYRAAKSARQMAIEEDDVVTIHLDWSENFNLKQARPDKASYYYEQHISILSGYVWKKDDCYSFGSVSDDTNHMSEAAWTALQPILNNLQNNSSKITKLNFISDSPVSQYRNKTTFYLLKQYATSNGITVKWIYLETGHGKGIADAIGATIKRLMDQAVAFHPDESYTNALDLINDIKKNTTIKLFTYTKNEIDSFKKSIPLLTTVKGTASFHEVTLKPDGKFYAKDTSFGAERLLKVDF